MSNHYAKLQSYPIPIPGVPTALQPVVTDIEAAVENDAISCGEKVAHRLEIDIQHAEDVARAKLRRNAMAQLVVALLVTGLLGFVIVQLQHVPATILTIALSLVSIHCGILGVKVSHKHLYINFDVDVSVKGGIHIFKLSNWHPVNVMLIGLSLAFILSYFGIETFLVHDVNALYSGKQLATAVFICVLSWFSLLLQIFGVKFAGQLQQQVNNPAKNAVGARLM